MGFAQAPATPSPSAPPPDTQPAAPPAADTSQAAPVQQATPDAQQSAPAPAAEPAPAEEPAKPGEHADAPTAAELREAAVTEEELSHLLTGKTFYLRGGYQDNTLHFNEKGELDGNSPKASYTLSLVEIDRVKVDKHHVELEGVRYGLHFLGALATEDQSANVDRVKLTSKKKPLKITIDRELVVQPKKQRPEKADKKKNTQKPAPAIAAGAQPPAATQQALPSGQPNEATAPGSAVAATPLKKEDEATRHGMPVTTSPAEAGRMLHDALDRVFSAGIDDKMVATLPDYWKLYYKAVAEKTVYKPADPSVLRSSQVEKRPHLLMAFEPPSNEYAQNNGVAGMAMYHVIVGADGKPQEIAIGRPIGFGLDENAVDAIRKASFEPGIKDGKPVPVQVDLTVQFRIYSKRTASLGSESAKADSATRGPKLPGPYSVNLPQPVQTQPQ